MKNAKRQIYNVDIIVKNIASETIRAVFFYFYVTPEVFTSLFLRVMMLQSFIHHFAR